MIGNLLLLFAVLLIVVYVVLLFDGYLFRDMRNAWKAAHVTALVMTLAFGLALVLAHLGGIR